MCCTVPGDEESEPHSKAAFASSLHAGNLHRGRVISGHLFRILVEIARRLRYGPIERPAGRPFLSTGGESSAAYSSPLEASPVLHIAPHDLSAAIRLSPRLERRKISSLRLHACHHIQCILLRLCLTVVSALYNTTVYVQRLRCMCACLKPVHLPSPSTLRQSPA